MLRLRMGVSKLRCRMLWCLKRIRTFAAMHVNLADQLSIHYAQEFIAWWAVTRRTLILIAMLSQLGGWALKNMYNQSQYA